MKTIRLLCPLILIYAVCGCNVPEAPRPSGGIELPPDDSACARGFVVLESQYQSTNVAILDLSGAVLSDSLLASNTNSGGLFASLSGDVVPMSSLAVGPELPLIDRAAGSGAVHWVELTSGKIVRSVAVDTGFPAYPQDYAPISTRRAYVSRFGHNLSPNEMAFDAGSDLLIVDPAAAEISGSIDLRAALGDEAVDNLPRPGRIAIHGDKALVLLSTLPERSFSATTSSRLAVVNTASDFLEEAIVLGGLRNCSGLAISPNRAELAIFCSALVDTKGGVDLESSGIVLVDLQAEPVVKRVLSSSVLGARPVGSYGDYATESVLLVGAFGAFDTQGQVTSQDSLLRIDLDNNTVEAILESEDSPFTLGGIACDAACGVCLVADAGREGGVVHRYEIDMHGSLTSVSAVKIEERIGLPPRYIGRF